MPLRSKNSPPSGRLTVRITSLWDVSSLTSASAALSAASGVTAFDDRDDLIDALRKCGAEHRLLLPPG